MTLMRSFLVRRDGAYGGKDGRVAVLISCSLGGGASAPKRGVARQTLYRDGQTEEG